MGDRVAKDALFVINIVEEEVERRHSLDESALDLIPLFVRNDARHQIERKDAFDAFRFAVNREGDALIEKRNICRAITGIKFAYAER